MSLRRLLRLVVRLGVVALLVYAATRVDFRSVLRDLVLPAPDDTTVASQAAGESSTAPAPPVSAPAGPCVDLNSASRSDLERIVDIGGNRSREIVERRLVRPFTSLDDLSRVTGVGPATIADIRKQGLACVR